MKLSIIIPAYNVENNISTCIESLFIQGIEDFEVIIINDCSTDNTAAEIERLMQKYSDIIYINKPTNSGLSDTRNVGMERARGEYIMFLDSDDYLEPMSLKMLFQQIKKHGSADVIYFKYIVQKNEVSEVKRGYVSDSNRLYLSVEFLKNEMNKRHFPVPACFALYRRAFLKEYNITFKTGILHEDELWSPTVLVNAKTVLTTDVLVYHYMIRENSITQKKDRTKNGLDILIVCKDLLELSKNIENDKIRRLMLNHIAMLYMKGCCIGNLFRKPYNKKIDRTLPLRCSYFFVDKLKSIIFAISFKTYFFLDRIVGKKI